MLFTGLMNYFPVCVFSSALCISVSEFKALNRGIIFHDSNYVFR